MQSVCKILLLRLVSQFPFSDFSLQTLFDNMQEKAAAEGAMPPPKKTKKAPTAAAAPPDFSDFHMDGGDAKSSKAADKRLSVERIYQKKTQLEHILLRPDTYIGSVEAVTQVREKPETSLSECFWDHIPRILKQRMCFTFSASWHCSTSTVAVTCWQLKKTGKMFCWLNG